MIPRRLVLATANRGKAAELAELVCEWGDIEVTSLADVPGVVLPAEVGASYAENAITKARAVALATGLPALGDDSGLEVDALAGALVAAGGRSEGSGRACGGPGEHCVGAGRRVRK